MIDCIAICGDSFGLGVGISQDTDQMLKKSFGALIADNYQLPMKNYSRSGCCNFVIGLQVQKIIEQYNQGLHSPFVIITTTHHSRFVIPIDNDHDAQYSLSDVDYITNNIYNSESELRNKIPFDLKNNPGLISNTISNWIEWKKTGSHFLQKQFSLLDQKIPMVDNYFRYLYSDYIKREYDIALILKMHRELDSVKIPHLILTGEETLRRLVNRKNFLFNNWGQYVIKYPDNYKSGHCTDKGHEEVAEQILKKIISENIQF
jgi:hypothetical protein